MANWVVEGLIATSPRPGYRPGAEGRVPREHVDEWIAEKRAFGISSIMCLIADDQLGWYQRTLPSGLIAYYRDAGFEVAHLPTLDGLTEPYKPEEYERAWEFFQELPKPMLVHCSAGYDRTFRVVNHLVARLQEQGLVPE